MNGSNGSRPYRGRIAPSPTGYLHLGHARTFWIAQKRAVAKGGLLLLRNEDLDGSRCKPEFVEAMTEDLRWFGLEWHEGPDCGGPFVPYNQSQRNDVYRAAFERLRAGGYIYACACSRQDVMRALSAPHTGEDEPVYPGTCRPTAADSHRAAVSFSSLKHSDHPPKLSWRFKVPQGVPISFIDGNFGEQRFIAGRDFGDFVVWRHDDVPSYQLSVVVDDAAMEITEVVRGEDLLLSTARQILLYQALDLPIPHFYHCHLMRDEKGARLAKRHDSLSLRSLRTQGRSPQEIRSRFNFPE